MNQVLYMSTDSATSVFHFCGLSKFTGIVTSHHFVFWSCCVRRSIDWTSPASVAHAWGSQGHQVVAGLALAQLTPKARTEIERLLAQEPGETLVSISTWADEHKNSSTARWHYINFPRDSCTFDAARDCPDELGVLDHEAQLSLESRINIRATNLERTLIDAAVRPAYSGGVSEVAKAFELAKDVVSVNAMGAMLGKLQFTYPFHQSIGFYLERAGYRASSLDLMRRFPMEFDFYLTHDMGSTRYVPSWKLYVPEGF